MITGVILAGGLGTRLRSVLPDTPKVLAEVHGRPFLVYLLDQMMEAGIRRFLLCTGHLGDAIHAVLGDSYRGCPLLYSREETPLGTAGALRHAIPQDPADLPSDLWLVVNGDSFVATTLKPFLEWQQAHRHAASLLLAWVEDSSRFGTVDAAADGRILGFREKRGLAEPAWINAGVYLLPRRLLQEMPEKTPLSLEREVMPGWVENELWGFAVKAPFIDIGTPESLQEAASFFRPNLVRDAATRLRTHLLGSIATKQRLLEECEPSILNAAAMIVSSLRTGGKLLLCGNGGSAADCQHIAGELVSVLNQSFPRPGLAALAMTTDSSILTASANDFGYEGIFERQTQALARPGDVLIGISTSGNSENVVRALRYAAAHDVRTLVLTGASGGKMTDVAEIAIRVPSAVVQHIQEAHITIGHVLCDLVEQTMFGER